MRLIDLLHQRRQLAEKFTKEFQDRVEKDIKLYKCESSNVMDTLSVDLIESYKRRYNFQIPLIFTNHESMMSSMFDRVPELIFNPKGQKDTDKEQKVIAAYEYLKDKLDLESFMNDTAWWYVLSGFTSAHIGYTKKSIERPVLDEVTGEPVIDELTGKPKMYADYTYDDPTLRVGNPKHEVYSPESQFQIDGSSVPFLVDWDKMHPSEVKRIYNKEVKADSVIETTAEIKESTKTDVDRVTVYRYRGTLPEEVSGEIRGWKPDVNYQILFTLEDVLHKKPMQLGDKQVRLLKWHGPPNEFFGFGLGKLLRDFQREKSIRRGQQVRYADTCAYPKLLITTDTTIDTKTQRDPRENLVLTYTPSPGGQKPEYIAPPNMNAVVSEANQLADQDAQQASGLMDISTGSQQSSTVDTATGQTIFADAAEKRVRYAKKRFMKFYREVVILLLKMAQANWASDKMVNITDDDGNKVQVSVSGADLQDVDFDLDVDVDIESVSINKDVLREQAIAMYREAKDDTNANRKELLMEAMRTGFLKKNPEKFIAEPVAPPGTQLVNPQTGEQYLVDESGNLTTPQAQEMMPAAAPAGNGIASNAGALAGSVQ